MAAAEAQGATLRAAGALLAGGSLRVMALAGLAALLVSFDSAVLVLALPAIAADFRTPVAELTRVGSALALGTLAALPIAMQADRVGRRRLLVLSVAGFSLANLASAWSPSVAWLAASRVVAVCFETVAAGTATALVIEEVSPDLRGLAVAGLTVMAGAGTGLTTLLYPLLAPHWRVLYLLGGAGLAGAGVLALLLPESRAWRASMTAGGRRRLPLRVLLEPPWRRRLAVVAVSGAAGALLYAPAALLSALFGSRELGLSPTLISAVTLVSGLASVPAFLVGGRLSDRWGRRRLGAGLGLLTAVATAATFAGGRAAYWAGSVLWSILASASVPVLGAWYGELFPTRARATSESAGAVAGAIGGAAGFQLVGLLQQRLGLGHALAAVSAGALLGAGLLLLLPETGGEPLEP
jgi:MFS family permease